MSSDFYFKRWSTILQRLENIVELDFEYQSTQVNDKTLCNAVARWTGILGSYLAVYKDILECVQLNLQVQKTSFLENICKAVINRIRELITQIKQLEPSDYLFLNNGLVDNKLTTNDVEISEVHPKLERSEQLQTLVDKAFNKEKERRRLEELKLTEEKNPKPVTEKNWWDRDQEESSDEEDFESKDKVKELTEEQIEVTKNLALIQAHERSRQVINWITKQRNQKERWRKQLDGTINPEAPYEIREKSAAIIQKVCRKFFELKRKRVLDCKRDELLGLRSCIKPKTEAQNHIETLKQNRSNLKKQYNVDWNSQYDDMKEKYLRLRGDDIMENYRDFVRDWFRDWFEQIQYFIDVPEENKGGIASILKEETLPPLEWLEEHTKKIVEMKSNKNKGAMQIKYEKKEAKREKMMLKREENLKRKLAEQLKRKMMKNPNKHPGYNYPKSRKTANLIKAIEHYHIVWDELDATDCETVKEKFNKQVDISNICMEVKTDLTVAVHEDMKKEFELLKQALVIDYQNNEEAMIEEIKEKKQKKKEVKPRKLKKIISENITDTLDHLVFRGFLKEYPKTKLKDFLGDVNFAGDQLRSEYKQAFHCHGETRNIWWQKCRELSHGFHKILLVGPKSSGKTLLVHALASINDAILFELDTKQIRSEFVTAIYLNQVVNYVAKCARILQPAVIHIKHVQKLYYRKVPSQEAEIDYELFRRYFVKKLLKKIHKSDNITVIATCIDPWVAQSKPMLKQFPNVVMMPETSYSITVQFLKEWVLNNHTIPPDFNVNSLAYVLKGYSIGFLKQILQDFLSPERIVTMKINGLAPMEVYNYVIENDTEGKIDYQKYRKWYFSRTAMGKKEQKHLIEQKEFKQALEKFEQRLKKRKKKEPSVASNSSSNVQNSFPRNDQSSSPRNAQSSSPRNDQSSFPRNDQSSSPRNAQSSSPRNAQSSSPINAQNSSPRNAQSSSPKDGQSSSPRNAQNSSPRNAQSSSPKGGQSSSPTNA